MDKKRCLICKQKYNISSQNDIYVYVNQDELSTSDDSNVSENSMTTMKMKAKKYELWN